MTFQELLEDVVGFETQSYSGRNMYGETCLGVVVENLAYSLQNIGYIAGMKDIDIPDRVLWDNMGKDYIIYWPDVDFKDKE